MDQLTPNSSAHPKQMRSMALAQEGQWQSWEENRALAQVAEKVGSGQMGHFCSAGTPPFPGLLDTDQLLKLLKKTPSFFGIPEITFTGLRGGAGHALPCVSYRTPHGSEKSFCTLLRQDQSWLGTCEICLHIGLQAPRAGCWWYFHSIWHSGSQWLATELMKS